MLDRREQFELDSQSALGFGAAVPSRVAARFVNNSEIVDLSTWLTGAGTVQLADITVKAIEENGELHLQAKIRDFDFGLRGECVGEHAGRSDVAGSEPGTAAGAQCERARVTADHGQEWTDDGLEREYGAEC